MSLASTQWLQEAELLASTGSTGGSYDNALAESIHGLYNAEVELATLARVDWFNNRRLLERPGHIPPVEAEKAYYASRAHNDLAA